jgi:hypothetical protein
MNNYTGASFANNNYWTSDATGSNQFNVNSNNGNINWNSPSNSNYVVCA